MKQFRLVLAIACSLFACNNVDKPVQKQDVLASHVDTTVEPGDDIFMYANGGWIKANPVPAEEAGWGIANLVVDENTKRLRELSEKAAAEKAAKGTASQKIGDFWQTAMDTIKIEKDDLAPLKPYLDRIAAINDTKSLQAVLAELDQVGVNGLIDFSV